MTHRLIRLSVFAVLSLSLLPACRNTAQLTEGECSANSDCDAATPFCVEHACVACLADSDCAAGFVCTGYECVATQPVAEMPQVDPNACTGANCAEARACSASRLDPILFDFDQSSVRADGRAIIEAAWACLESTPAVTVEGHADERGTSEYNLALAERRARSIQRYMSDRGYAGNARTISYGENMPVDRGQNESAYSRNRRGEVVLTR